MIDKAMRSEGDRTNINGVENAVLFNGVSFLSSTLYNLYDDKSTEKKHDDLSKVFKNFIKFEERKGYYRSLFKKELYEEGIIKIYEYLDGIQVNKFILPSGNVLEGKIRIFVTMYDYGIMILSIYASIFCCPKYESDIDISNNLRAIKSLNIDDLLYLYENQFHDNNHNNTILLDDKIISGNFENIIDEFIMAYKINDITSERIFEKHCRSLSIWDIDDSKKYNNVKSWLLANYESIFPLVITPTSDEYKYSISKKKYSVANTFEVTSQVFSYSLTYGGLIIINNRKSKPDRDALGNVLVQLYQFINMQEYAIKYFNTKVKRLFRAISDKKQKINKKLIKEIEFVSENYLNFINEFYWISPNIRSIYSRDILLKYQTENNLHEYITDLKNRFDEMNKIIAEERNNRIDEKLNKSLLFLALIGLFELSRDYLHWAQETKILPFSDGSIILFGFLISIAGIILLYKFFSKDIWE